ncbi:MAG: hypothetical protein AB9842_08170 [Bacteroidales bacterium]
MIKLSDYNSYFNGMLQKIPSLKHYLLAATESDLAEKIRNMRSTDFPVLVVIIPSADTIAADSDNISEASSCLLYVLDKANQRDKSHSDFVSLMSSLQSVITAIKNQLKGDKENHVAPHLLCYMDFNRMHTDPEYNFLECCGWSLSFTLLTPGF